MDFYFIYFFIQSFFSDDYWERRYSIKADQIPAFLHANVDKILRTGKYLNVIQQCEQSKAKKTYYKAERSKPRGLINPFKKPSDVTDAKIDDDTEDLRYFENPGMYSINKIRKTQNEHLNIVCQNLNSQ